MVLPGIKRGCRLQFDQKINRGILGASDLGIKVRKDVEMEQWRTRKMELWPHRKEREIIHGEFSEIETSKTTDETE